MLAACLPRQDYVWITTEQLVCGFNERISELDSEKEFHLDDDDCFYYFQK